MGSHDDQRPVLEFLNSPQAYDPPPPRVETVETHASIVFLAGDRAYKLKRAVKYPFLDFSTLGKRRAALLNELRVNRRTAPDLYLEVLPVVRTAGGGLRIGGEGEALEWLLLMRRFDQASLYDRKARDGLLPIEAMPRLAKIIADFHRSADRQLSAASAVSRLGRVFDDNRTTLAGAGIIPSNRAARFNDNARSLLSTLVPLLSVRALGGYVRHCHGDLHLRNIVEIGGAPILFDAIEFDDNVATVDLLYDLAFLLMDLGERGLAAHANALLNAYLDEFGDSANLLGLAALPLFIAMRAAIRAKVELLRGRLAEVPARIEAEKAALSYFRFAKISLKAERPRLIAVAGLSGSGKSSVARALAPHLGGFPGAVILQSDRERKRLFRIDPYERLPDHAYGKEITNTVYRLLRRKAAMALAAGRSVIVDAVHAKPEERLAIAKVAERAGVAFTGLWLDVPIATMEQRVAARGAVVSDADIGVLRQQVAYDLGPQQFKVVDGSRPLDEVVGSCLQILGERGGP